MKNAQERIVWILRFLGSRRLALTLIGILCAAMLVSTFSEQHAAGRIIAPVFLAFGVNLLLCTVQRIKTLPPPALVMHTGMLVVIVGGMISASGFVATVNVYEDSSVDSAYRWDLQREFPLGMDLRVKKISLEYYPVPVKVGVLKDGMKDSLHELRTGGSFRLGPYTVTAEELDLEAKKLRLAIAEGERQVGRSDTAGAHDLPSGFPYRFVLVAFKDPQVRRTSVLLELLRDSEVVASGSSEVNSPFSWNGMNFSYVQLGRDQYGLSFAGIQITRDPGRPYVFGGFAVTGIGAFASCIFFLRRQYGKH